MPDRLKAPGKITLTRPDGTVLQATPEQAEKLRLLGYEEETPFAQTERAQEAGREDYYTGTAQKVLTAGEGFLRGATVGISDVFLGDEATRARAQYNPGAAIASEVIGSIAPVLLTAGTAAPEAGAGLIARAAAATPTAMLGRTSAGAVRGLESKLARTASAAAIEGSVAGGASTINHAYLEGDDLTAEAVLSGVGWGTLFGAGMGTVAGGASLAASRKLSKLQETEELVRKAAKPLSEAETPYRLFHAETKNLGTFVGRTAKEINGSIDNMVDEAIALRHPGVYKQDLRIGAKKAFDEQLSNLRTATYKGDPELIAKANDKFMSTFRGIVNEADEMANAAEAAGQKAARMPGHMNETNLVANIQRLTKLGEVGKILTNEMPQTVEGFSKLGAEKAERLFGAINALDEFPEFKPLTSSLFESARGVGSSLGISLSEVKDLRGMWSSTRTAVETAKNLRIEEPGPGILRRTVSTALGAAFGKSAREATGSTVAGAAAFQATKDMANETGKLVQSRNAVLARLSSAAKSFSNTVKFVTTPIRKAGARIAPLAISINGTLDNAKEPQQELAMKRIAEFAQANQSVNDTLYMAVEPMAGTQPYLAPALHKAAVARFQAFRAMLPADPGVVSRLKSVWKPSTLEAAVMSKQYEVFLDPVGSAERMLESGRFDPIQIKALKELSPAIFQHMRGMLIERISMPGFLNKMSLNEQIGLGTMIDVPIHSSMRPEFIAMSLQLHTKRAEPMETPQQPGMGNSSGSGGTAANSPTATASQRVTER